LRCKRPRDDRCDAQDVIEGRERETAPGGQTQAEVLACRPRPQSGKKKILRPERNVSRSRWACRIPAVSFP